MATLANNMISKNKPAMLIDPHAIPVLNRF
jgi:hypothetical protein